MKRKRICGILFGYTTERINYTMFVLKLIKKWLTHTCAYFTVVTLIYMIIQAIVNVSDEALVLDAGRTALFFLFSLLIALANTVFSIDKLITALKVTLHFVIVMFAFYACLLLPLSMPASSIFVGLALGAVVYAVIMGLVAVFRSRFKKISESSEKYEKKFNKKAK